MVCDISEGRMRKLAGAIVLVSFLLVNTSVAGIDQVTTILLVRHAEKSTTPPENPLLNEKGRARAASLVTLLGAAGIQAIFTSQYARTHETAEPLAKHLGLTIQQRDAGDTQKLIGEILSRYRGKVVLIVGHSNTLPEMIQALGGGTIPEIEDTEFDNLFVVTVYGPGKAKAIRLKTTRSSG